MNAFRCLMAAAVVAIPAILSSLPAQALTTRQYQAQGRGHYISSWGHRPRGLYHRRGYRHHGRYRHAY